jgi:hypothetical protein
MKTSKLGSDAVAIPRKRLQPAWVSAALRYDAKVPTDARQRRKVQDYRHRGRQFFYYGHFQRTDGGGTLCFPSCCAKRFLVLRTEKQAARTFNDRGRVPGACGRQRFEGTHEWGFEGTDEWRGRGCNCCSGWRLCSGNSSRPL